MTLLDCAVTGCAYNEDRCCCKGNIKVEGSEAVHPQLFSPRSTKLPQQVSF